METIVLPKERRVIECDERVDKEEIDKIFSGVNHLVVILRLGVVKKRYVLRVYPCATFKHLLRRRHGEWENCIKPLCQGLNRRMIDVELSLGEAWARDYLLKLPHFVFVVRKWRGKEDGDLSQEEAEQLIVDKLVKMLD